MAKFEVILDLTLSGTFEIEAKTKEEAKQIIMHKYLDNYARSDMHELSREVYEINEI